MDSAGVSDWVGDRQALSPLQLYRRTGQLAPTVQQRERPLISDAQLTDLQQQVDMHPEASLEQHLEAWDERHGVRVSRSTMCRALARADRPLKKNGQGHGAG